MKIILIKIDDIGDNILFIPFVDQLIKDKHEVYILSSSKSSDLYLDKNLMIFKYNKNNFQIIKSDLVSCINANGPYNILINASFSPKDDSIYLSEQINSLRKYSFLGNSINLSRYKISYLDKVFTKLVKVPSEHTPEYQKNKILYNQIFNNEISSYFPKIVINRDDRLKVLNILRTHKINRSKLIVLFSGVGTKIREYYNFNSALNLFSKKFDFQVISLGSKSDFDINQSNLPVGIKTLNLCGKLSLNESLALISLSKCALGGETGLAHGCSALGVPHAIILGGGHIGRFMPYSCFTIPIIVDLDCLYCNWQCSKSSNFCITDVSEKSIYSALYYAWNFDYSKQKLILQNNNLYNKNSKIFQNFLTHFLPYQIINQQ